MTEEKYFENIRSFKFLAKKEIGQNFLGDPDSAKRIVSLLEAKEGEKVLEIGSGAGSLSYFLSLGPAKADLIDIDEAMLQKLKEDFEGNPYLNIQFGNAMRYDYSSYDKIVGNLPYYITSGIIENVLLGAKKATRYVFMVQKEAAARLLAKPGSEDYSPLTIYLNYVAKGKKAFNVRRECFVPAPHVESTVLVFDVDLSKQNEESKAMYSLAKKLFLNRRKTILNNLKNVLGDSQKAEEALKACGIAPTLRPENLLAENYLALSHYLKESVE